mgnify:FL=1
MSVLESLPEGVPEPRFKAWNLEDAIWVGEHWDELKRKYAGLYIAIYKKQVIDYDKNYDTLRKRLRKMVEDPEVDVLIIYVPRRRIKMLI